MSFGEAGDDERAEGGGGNEAMSIEGEGEGTTVENSDI